MLKRECMVKFQYKQGKFSFYFSQHNIAQIIYWFEAFQVLLTTTTTTITGNHNVFE